MKRAFVLLSVFAAFFFLVVSATRAQYEVPILMYHRVGYPDAKIKSPFVTLVTFEKQMQFLKAHNYRVVSLEEIVKTLRDSKPIPMNTVAITFDDGTLDNFTQAFPVLKKMNFPATIFMITDNIGKEGWLGEEDLRILSDAGIAIGSHTTSHAFLPNLLSEDIVKEITESKTRLEKTLEKPVTLFSYPAGGSSPKIVHMVQEAGYAGAVTTNYGKTRHDRYRLHRIKVGESGGSLFNFWLKTTGLYHVGKKRVEPAGDEA